MYHTPPWYHRNLAKVSQRISFSRNSDLSSVELNLLADLSRLIVTVATTHELLQGKGPLASGPVECVS